MEKYLERQFKIGGKVFRVLSIIHNTGSMEEPCSVTLIEEFDCCSVTGNLDKSLMYYTCNEFEDCIKEGDVVDLDK